MKLRKFVIVDQADKFERKKNRRRHRSPRRYLFSDGSNVLSTLPKQLILALICLCVMVAMYPSSRSRSVAMSKVATVQSLQQQAAQIANQITTENNKLDQLDQQYLTAQQNLKVIDQNISNTQSQIEGLTKSQLAIKAQIRQEALAAYVEAESGQGLSSVLNSNAVTIGLKETYLESATGNLSASVAQLVDVQNKLNAQENSLTQQQASEQQQVNSLNQAKNQATQIQTNLVNTENGLKGQIATMVAQQQAAARAAAAAAAAARFRQEQAAQAAALAAAAINSNRASYNIPIVAGSGAGAAAVRAAMSYIGVWYQWGGTSRNGVDCSGLTMISWEAAGVQLPRTAQEQYYATAHVALTNPSQWQPGDLVFYGYGISDIFHVAMYIGGGQVVEALQTGTQVQVDSLFYAGTPVAIGQP